MLQAADNSLSDRFSHPAVTALNPNISRRLNALTAHYTAADASRISAAFFLDLGGRGVIDVVLQVLPPPSQLSTPFKIQSPQNSSLSQLEGGRGISSTALFNNDIGPSLFLKAEIRRRNCTWTTCGGIGGTGVACAGASATASVQDNDGVYR